MKTITELKADQELLITAVNILDKITMEENDISREDADFTAYESWAVTDVKNELQAKIGELQVLIEYQQGNTDEADEAADGEQVTEPLTTTIEEARQLSSKH